MSSDTFGIKFCPLVLGELRKSKKKSGSAPITFATPCICEVVFSAFRAVSSECRSKVNVGREMGRGGSSKWNSDFRD